VVDEIATRALVAEARPDVIFHAAAHKHVPLMEDHPSHAVENNFFGTKSIADAALASGVDRVVLISSDKAVNPTSVMGATKRLAERYVQGLNRRGDHATRCTMVRFGNVLGSACSVLPIWSAQLAEGAALTVTDPRMTRYFMTIGEAASLVVQSASLEGPPETSGEIFLLDMGEPVRILELAQRFVRSHGLAPRVVAADGLGDVDGAHDPSSSNGEADDEDRVDIVITGSRPGEKLHEELALAAERIHPTPLDGIGAWVGAGDPPDLGTMVSELSAVRRASDRAAVLRAIRAWVPEMAPPAPADIAAA
ncbi:MAG: polysaccharide biosynthesis protein, partial [Planctomycetota bacterium]